jgi:hypothetical protein
MNEIVIIGSGPVGLLTAFYIYKKYDNIKCYIISYNFDYFHCTYCLFLEHIENTWIYDYFDKSKLFLNVTNINIDFHNHESLEFDNKYGIINNEYLHNTIIDYLKTTNAEFIKGNVIHINKRSDKYNILFKNNKSYKNIYVDFVFEATGNNNITSHKNVNINSNNSISSKNSNGYIQYYQYFYGYKLYFENGHDFNNCTLLNWNIIEDNYKIKSFCYVLPYDKNTVLIEETILSTNIKRYYYDLLETRLNKRIKKYALKDYHILDKEVYKIPLNKPIQNSNETNFSFKIGVCGNMINNLSGYALGYNIYHIPEFCNYMNQGNFSHNYVISNYWNNNRNLINNINSLGLKLMENMTQEDLSEFHYYYFKQIFNTNNFNILFLNKDTNITYFQIIRSFSSYMYFPKKFLALISSLLIKSIKNKFSYYYYNEC